MTKKEKKTNKDSYLSAVKFELKKVSWPKIKDIFKYTCATIVFCLVLAGYFSLLNLILSLITTSCSMFPALDFGTNTPLSFSYTT